jgi:hypothetical protein
MGIFVMLNSGTPISCPASGHAYFTGAFKRSLTKNPSAYTAISSISSHPQFPIPRMIIPFSLFMSTLARKLSVSPFPVEAL